jgi:Fe-Mn family superoxide dismutase
LTHDQHFTEHGVGEMLSAGSYNYAWTSYQSYILQCLNKMTDGTFSPSTSIPSSPNPSTTGTPQEFRLTKDILITYARDPAAASLFNHASMAWNNHQFFSTLSPNPTPPSQHLTTLLSKSFGNDNSLENLRATMIATANAMFGPGFVWLVKRRTEAISSKNPEFAILTTYLAGSPLPGAHYRKQEQDTNTALRAGSWGPMSGQGPKIAPGGANIEVLLGVNTWQHVWLRDYGFGGKKRYLENWWESVDWRVVEDNAQMEVQRKGGRLGL